MKKQDYIQVGHLGKAHGLRGELRFTLEDQFVEDVLKAGVVLVGIGKQKIPYFIETFRKDTLVKFEEVDDKTAATLLQHKHLFLKPDQVTKTKLVEEEGTPFDELIEFTISDAEIGEIGSISVIVDLPQHYLAEVDHQGRMVMIPLHEDLILSVDRQARILNMQLPEGLLDL